MTVHDTFRCGGKVEGEERKEGSVRKIRRTGERWRGGGDIGNGGER